MLDNNTNTKESHTNNYSVYHILISNYHVVLVGNPVCVKYMKLAANNLR